MFSGIYYLDEGSAKESHIIGEKFDFYFSYPFSLL
jgi:hypothetical protein